MTPNLQYIQNAEGEQQAVIISMEEWIVLWQDYQRLLHYEKQYEKLKQNLTEAFQEVQAIKAGKEESISLTEFLDAC